MSRLDALDAYLATLTAMLDDVKPMPPAIEVTAAEFEALKATCPPPPETTYGIQVSMWPLLGVPIVIVDPEAPLEASRPLQGTRCPACGQSPAYGPAGAMEPHRVASRFIASEPAWCDGRPPVERRGWLRRLWSKLSARSERKL